MLRAVGNSQVKGHATQWFARLPSLWRQTGNGSTAASSDRGEYELLGGNTTGRRNDVNSFGANQSDHTRLQSHDPDEAKQLHYSPSQTAADDGLDLTLVNERAPTDEEKATLRKVADSLPWSAFLIAVVELCERFTYYGLSGPFQNYIANSAHDPSGLPGAIGLGQTGATALVNLFTLLCNLTPVLGAIVADQYLGKYWAIYYFSLVYIAGVFILFLTSLPIAIENGAALGGLVIAMFVMGIGTGGIKSNVSPLIAEQYRNVKPYIRILRNGERVIVDPTVTIQRIYMIFYTCINIGSLSAIATTEMELYIGFWSAYLLCFVMFVIAFTILVHGRDQYVVRPPRGSVIPHAIRVCWIGLRHRSLNAAKPGYQLTVPWDAVFVEEVRRALIACKVFLFYPIYWVVYGQMLNNFVSQAGQMQLHGVPNDIMQNIDPITIIIFIPIMDQVVYPFLRRRGIPFQPITRIFMGFIVGAAAMVYAAGVQKVIYAAEPCYTAPRACDAGLLADGTYAPNSVHVAIQIPAYLLIGLSEIFALVTGLEYAYTKAPTSMKSFIMSIYLLTNAIGSAFGAALSPFAVDPKLFWLYIGLAITCFLAGLLFWTTNRKLNELEETMNELEQYGSEPIAADEIPIANHPRNIDGEHID